MTSLVMVHRGPDGRLAWVRTEITGANVAARTDLLRGMATPAVEHRLFTVDHRGDADLRRQVHELAG